MAGEESKAELLERIGDAHMVFITAGMGGGTGTGAAPVIARTCLEAGVLTVAVVTRPFRFEGTHRMRLAEEGLRRLQDSVDTLLVIPNQNLFKMVSACVRRYICICAVHPPIHVHRQAGRRMILSRSQRPLPHPQTTNPPTHPPTHQQVDQSTTLLDAFRLADDVLLAGVKSVTDLMTMPGLINLDFADVQSVMSGMGNAIMGTGQASGEERALRAAEDALKNPLLGQVGRCTVWLMMISVCTSVSSCCSGR